MSPFFMRECRLMSLQVDEIQGFLEPSLAQAGFECVGIEITSGQRYPLVRLFVDVPGGGINAQQLSEVNHHVLDGLRLAGLDTERLQLEISSPGLNRRLFNLAQCVPFIGQQIAVKLRQPIEKRSRFKGTLTAIEDDALVVDLEEGEETLRFDWAQVAKANVVPQLDKFLTDKKKR